MISLNNIDRRITVAALLIFAVITTSLIFLTRLSRKRNLELPPGEDAGKNKATGLTKNAPEVREEPSKIPSIDGRNLMWYDRDVCTKLFEILYAKEFFDSEDSKTAKIIDAFAKHVQDREYGKDIRVKIYKDEAAPKECRDELDAEGCIFHTYTSHHNFGSSTYREIAMSSAFFDSLKKLPQMPTRENFTDEHKKLLREVVGVLEFALRKVNQ